MRTPPLKLRIEIEAMCNKAGIPFGDVTSISILPMEIRFTVLEHAMPGFEHVVTIPYVWEKDQLVDDTEEVRQASYQPGTPG